MSFLDAVDSAVGLEIGPRGFGIHTFYHASSSYYNLRTIHSMHPRLQLALWNSANQNSFAICILKIATHSANYERICKILQ